MSRIAKRAKQIGRGLGTEAKRYLEWENAQKQQVHIESMGDELKAKLCDVELAFKQCYMNAMNTSLVTGCDYIEGYATNGIIVYGHAWNAVGNHHFDATEELLLASRHANCKLEVNPNYVQIVRLSCTQVTKLTLKMGVYGIKAAYYAQNVLGLEKKGELKKFAQQYWTNLES
jgi:hypothetical protein